MRLIFTASVCRLALWAGLTACAPLLGAQNVEQSGAPAPPPAATGAGERTEENPPLTGLDKPVAEPKFGGRSYLVPGLQLGQSVEGYSGNGGDVYAVTRALGSLDLLKNWRTSQFGLDYVVGGSFYEGANFNSRDVYQMHTMSAIERIFWRSGQLAIRDSFNYLPEGTFGYGSYGGMGGFDSTGGLGGVGPGSGIGGGLGGTTPPGFGGVGYGTYGVQPQVYNTTVVDVDQALSARSSVTLAGGYSIGHYLDQSSSPFPLFNYQQTTAQAGYDRLLNPRDQVAFSYAFQQFHYPEQSGVGSIEAHVFNVLYGHRITGRLNFVVAAGPEWVTIHNPAYKIEPLPGLFLTLPPSSSTDISGNGSVTFSYTVSARTSVSLGYYHFVSAGSGYYAGAQTDALSATVSHSFARQWTTTTSLGLSHNSNLQTSAPASAATAPTYNYWYIGTSIRRQIGRHFNAFASYQYDRFAYGGCARGVNCGTQAGQNIVDFGIEWHPNPLRLD
jgi:hypothetical protein